MLPRRHLRGLRKLPSAHLLVLFLVLLVVVLVVVVLVVVVVVVLLLLLLLLLKPLVELPCVLLSGIGLLRGRLGLRRSRSRRRRPTPGAACDGGPLGVEPLEAHPDGTP